MTNADPVYRIVWLFMIRDRKDPTNALNKQESAAIGAADLVHSMDGRQKFLFLIPISLHSAASSGIRSSGQPLLFTQELMHLGEAGY